jgi:hypothetical protein
MPSNIRTVARDHTFKFRIGTKLGIVGGVGLLMVGRANAAAAARAAKNGGRRR